ncbi:anti-phage ATPase IteA [Comamonas aquatica]|uniref:ATP-binding protein n=1 Tax=Comamonas aquatica TaxID=225991 RepID=A0AA42HUP3_9BURK|nr:anti-phage ATPase IteA [Comamonas aquatica]MDH0364663.1 ATP-binding protein [Comamonas aquatica]
MQHLSEVLKILDGALKANSSIATSYAGLLADKLENDGEKQQARLIRERLARAPQAVASAQGAGHGHLLGQMPTDNDSRLNTVDYSQPTLDSSEVLLPDAIQARLLEFIQCVEHHDALQSAGAAMASRVLIYGPPGTGKTQTARWIAARLKLPLLTVRCDTLVSSLLGQTSRNLRRVFDYAQQFPCVLFLDEFDALAGARGNERDIGELQRVVIALLQNMDALPDSTVLVASTNHEQLLDPAIGRRFPFHLPMPVPDTTLRAALWRKLLGDFAPEDLDLAELAALSEGVTGATIEHVSLDAKRSAVLSGLAHTKKLILLRRLGLTLALMRGERLFTTGQEIRWLRAWAPAHFTLRALMALYNLPMRQIQNTLSEDKGLRDGNEKKAETGKKKRQPKQSIRKD